MTIDVEINGRSRTVSVERSVEGRYRVTVDGRPHDVDVARVGSLGLSLLLEAANGASRDVQVAPGGRTGELLIRIDGRMVLATVNGRRTGRGASEAGGHAHGDQPVVAPMPGRVVRVLVSPGEAVAARQGVVVVEAMKMENELRAPKAGRVKEVAVEPGASVEAGRVLVVIE
jgi:biotin carboxyl carrier protein